MLIRVSRMERRFAFVARVSTVLPYPPPPRTSVGFITGTVPERTFPQPPPSDGLVDRQIRHRPQPRNRIYRP